MSDKVEFKERLYMTEPAKTVTVSRATIEAYWTEFAAIGPRHRHVARWIYVLGWRIAEEPMRAYLAPELATVH